MVKYFYRTIGGIKMGEKLVCPLCGSSNLIKSKLTNNEKYFMFVMNDKWICQTCGCFFSEKDDRKPREATEISKREYFQIIFSAIEEICGRKKLKRKDKKRVIETYLKHTKKFYREVAEMQANLFLETDCIQKDHWLIEKMRSYETKLSLDI